MFAFLALFILTTSTPARAVWPFDTPSTSAGAGPKFQPSCDGSLVPTVDVYPDEVDRVEELLRWIGAIHPAYEAAWADEKEDFESRLTFLHLATGFTIAPRKGPHPRSHSEAGWYANQLDLEEHGLAALDAERRILLAEKPDGPQLTALANRVLLNLACVLNHFVREPTARATSVAVKIFERVRFPRVVFNSKPAGALREDLRRILAPLEHDAVVRQVRLFLARELPLIVRLRDVRGDEFTSLVRTERLGAEREALSKELDARIVAFVSGLRRNERPARAALGPGRPFAAKVFAEDPARFVHRDAAARWAFDRVEIQREVHVAGAGLNDVLARAPAWPDDAADFARWIDAPTLTAEWLETALAEVDRFRGQTFATLAGLRSLTEDTTALRGWSEAQVAAIEPLGAPALLDGARRLRDVVAATAGAFGLRAEREGAALDAIHRFEMLVARHQQDRLGGGVGFEREVRDGLRDVARALGPAPRRL